MSWCVNVLRSITVEPVLFTFMLGTFLKIPVTQQLTFKKTCIELYNETYCNGNFSRGTCGHSTAEEDHVQSRTSQWIFIQTVALCIPSIVSSLFLGSWSDKFGRKLVILLPLIGGSCEAIAAVINIHYFDASAVYLLPGNVLSGMFGGFSTILMALFAYMADITKDKENRTMRIGVLESMIFLGGTIGELISGILIERLGFMAPYITVLSLNVLAIIYVLVLLCESYIPPEQCRNQKLFSINNFKGSVEVYIKKRPHNRRLYLALTLIVGFFVPLLVFTGTNDVIILFVLHQPFCFKPSMIGFFLAVSFGVKSLGTLIGLPIMSHVLKFSDCTIAAAGILTNMTSTAFLAFAKNNWQLFLAVSTGIFNGVTIPSMRAMMSKLVDFDEHGSLFAVAACAEIFTSLVASFIFNNIYKMTVSTLPGLSFLLMTGILLVPLILMIYMYRCKKAVNFSLNNDDENELIDSEESAA